VIVHKSVVKSCQILVVRSSRVGLVHQRDLARDSSPLEFAAKRLITSLTLVLFPLKEFVGESKMRLNDDIQSSCSDEAAAVDVNGCYNAWN